MAISIQDIAADAARQIQHVETASSAVAIAVKADLTKDNLVFVGRSASGIVAVSVFTRRELEDETDMPSAFRHVIRNLLAVIDISASKPRQAKPAVVSSIA